MIYRFAARLVAAQYRPNHPGKVRHNELDEPGAACSLAQACACAVTLESPLPTQLSASPSALRVRGGRQHLAGIRGAPMQGNRQVAQADRGTRHQGRV